VAAFAGSGGGKLLTVQLLVALVAGLVVLWFAEGAWFPVMREAIQALPERGEISQRTLHWETNLPVTLASGHFLAIAVKADPRASLGSPSHVRLQFGPTNAAVCSLLGCLNMDYPQGWRIAFNRPELQPWWEARETFVRLGVVGLAGAAVWISWQLLGVCYCLPLWLAASLGRRQLSFAGAWRTAGAALIPGAVIMLVTIALYRAGALDVVRFLFGAGLHFIVGWGYLIAAVFFLPRSGSAECARVNPFVPTSRRRGDNPFD
jgi:hypothetical protein